MTSKRSRDYHQPYCRKRSIQAEKRKSKKYQRNMSMLAPYQHEPQRKREDSGEPQRKRTRREKDNGDGGNQNTRNSDASRLISTFWCACGNCANMPKLRENLCCHEVEGVSQKLQQEANDNNLKNPKLCITEHGSFGAVCVNKDVLWSAMVGMRDLNGSQIPNPIPNRTYRLAGYRMFTWWIHHYLGKGVRREVPACVVRRVREVFPEANGLYVGFEPGDLDLPWTW